MRGCAVPPGGAAGSRTFRSMAINWQKGTLFAAGLAVGVAGGVWGVMSFKDGNHAQPRPPAQAASTSTMGAPAATPTVAIAAPPGTCEQAPMLAKSDDGDGRESLLPKGGTASAGEVAAMILSGKEAAASGRARDAEVVFLNACRQAASLAGNERIALADSMYQLGRHYANVAALGAPKSRELFERAERLYSASLEAYTARYGANHEKTKFAQGGLTTVLQATGGSGVAAVAKAAPAAAPVQAAPPPVQVAQAAPAPPVMPSPPVARVEPPPPPAVHAPAPPPAVVHAPPAAVHAPPPPVVHAPPLVAAAPSAPPHRSAATPPPAVAPAVPRETAVARRTSPSFDCAKARSTTEKLICGDEELARMDRELGGLHHRAKQAAADPRAFQRNS
ncbi:MAG: hypothetical protein JWP41_4621, partial [Ramlibacter sp.]|nr:hypothetical protein [Ramlibacter sp.]